MNAPNRRRGKYGSTVVEPADYLAAIEQPNLPVPAVVGPRIGEGFSLLAAKRHADEQAEKIPEARFVRKWRENFHD